MAVARHAWGVPSQPHRPAALHDVPFRGSAAIRAGLLTRDQLAGPAWRRLFPDIYLDARAAVDHFVRCEAAALLLPPGAAVAGRSAAYLFHVDLLPMRESPVEVAVPATTSLRSRPGLRITRTGLLAEEVTAFSRIPVTTPLRTALDLARQPDLLEGVIAVDAMLVRGLVTLPQLRDFAAGRRGLRGLARAAKAMSLAVPGAESAMETRLRLLLVFAGLPTPITQYEVGNARLDLAYPELHIGIEYDGDHHRDRRRFRHDVARDNHLRALGWTILRFTADDVLRNPARLIRQVRTATETGR